MPKEAAAGSSQVGLVYLKYTFRYRGEFDELNDEWLSSIEATSDEFLGAYHYRNLALCRVPNSLPSVLFRALGKELFAECHAKNPR
jgi:hypothetical protein